MPDKNLSKITLAKAIAGMPFVTPQHEGYDLEAVHALMGDDKFPVFMAWLISHNKSLFCCGHATYPDGHVYAGYERHCIYAKDMQEYINANPNL